MADVNIVIEIDQTVQNVGITTTSAAAIAIAPVVSEVNVEVLPMAGGSGGGSFNPTVFVKGEIPEGVLDGSNNIFTSAFDFIPESVEVFINGFNQKPIQDFNTTGTKTILLSVSPLSGEAILINYIKQ